MVGGCSGWARLVGVLFEISIVCLFFVPWSVCGVVGSCVVAAAVVCGGGCVGSCGVVGGLFLFSGLFLFFWLWVAGACVLACWLGCVWWWLVAGFVLFFWFFLESLILAQDERWRRA